MIRLSGFTPDEDIPIVFTGIRPGEKLYEELWHKDDLEHTRHQMIFIKDSPINLPVNFEQLLESVLATASDGNQDSIKTKLSKIVPEYQGILAQFKEMEPGLELNFTRKSVIKL